MKRVLLGTLSLVIAFAAGRELRIRQASATLSARNDQESPRDSVSDLARLGYHPGRQLAVFVLGGSGCGFCQLPETKTAFGAIRSTLQNHASARATYASISTIGVAIDNDIVAGLTYLNSLGTQAFDEVSVGSGWRNEQVISLIRRQGFSLPTVPLVIVVSRQLDASLEPLKVAYSPQDSLVLVVQGSDDIVKWVEEGMPLDNPNLRKKSDNVPTK